MFFERDAAAIDESPQHARHEALAVGFEQMAGDLGQRYVRCDLDQGKDLRRMVSIRAERRSPPCTRASQVPVLRHSLTSSIAEDGATPNRAAAPRQLMPDLHGTMMRMRRSGERGLAMEAGLHRQPST